MGSEQKSFFAWIAELLFVGSLVAAGVLGAYVEFRARFLPDPRFSHEFEVGLTLAIVAFLALALGVERFARFRRIDKQFDNITSLLQRALSVRLLMDSDVAEQAIKLVNSAQKTIKVLLYEEVATVSPTISDWIAKRMEDEQHVEFYLVLVSSVPEDQNFWEIHRDRYQAYVTRKVQKRVHRYILHSTKPVGFDLLIVDDKHVGIQFSPISSSREQTKRLAIQFCDQPQIAGEIESWFDKSFLRPESSVVQYEDAEEQWWGTQ